MSQALHYRPLDCERVSGFRRLWPLARQEMVNLFRTKLGVALYFVCLFPSLGRLVMLLIMFGVIDFGPQALRDRLNSDLPPALDRINPARAAFYFETALSTMPGMVFFLLLTSMVVARCIARDRMTNALELYWTRGISPLGYLFAKWLGGFLLTCSMTAVMPLVLWISASMLAEDWSLCLETAPQVLVGVLAMVVMTAVWTAIGTLLSAIAGSTNVAMVAWSMLLVGTSAFAFVLSRVLDKPELRSALSLWDAGRVVVREVVGIAHREAASPMAAALLLCVLLFVTAVMARRRLRIEEALQ